MESEQSSEWLTLEQACSLLERTHSVVERLAATGAVQSKLIPRVGRKPQRLYLATDLEKVKASRKKTATQQPPREPVRQFVLPAETGTLVVTLPRKMSHRSIRSAVDFLQLVIRELVNLYESQVAKAD